MPLQYSHLKKKITLNMNYNPIIHDRRSIRLKGYDYSQAGLYFITICVQDRKCLFGKIVGVQNFEPVQPPNESVSSVGFENFDPIQKAQPRQEMILNDAGKIANECWLEIPKHFPNAVLHEHIVMPNHVHGIIELKQTVGVQKFEPRLQLPNESPRNEFQKIIPHSIGSIVRGYKTGVTKWFRNNNVGDIGVQNFEPLPIWQRNYYEHIICDEKSCQRISEYIINNPKNWKGDNFFNK
jgi:putative transposase